MHAAIQIRVEGKRGCGYRKVRKATKSFKLSPAVHREMLKSQINALEKAADEAQTELEKTQIMDTVAHLRKQLGS